MNHLYSDKLTRVVPDGEYLRRHPRPTRFSGGQIPRPPAESHSRSHPHSISHSLWAEIRRVSGTPTQRKTARDPAIPAQGVPGVVNTSSTVTHAVGRIKTPESNPLRGVHGGNLKLFSALSLSVENHVRPTMKNMNQQQHDHHHRSEEQQQFSASSSSRKM